MQDEPLPDPGKSPATRTAARISPPGLYLHIPFCMRKCGYCGFHSITDLAQIPSFLEALRREMALRRTEKDAFDTLYIGGGTPSLLSPVQAGRLLADLRFSFRIDPDAEITFEANPSDVAPDLLAALRDGGVNRLNLGIQSLDDRLLRFLGRRHDRTLAISAFAAVKAAGLARIGIDLIFGIPGQTVASWMATLREAIALSTGHLSCYQLTVEGGTPLAERCRTGEISLPGEEIQAELFLKTSEVLEREGYTHYEVSNFARPGEESRHNRKYWDHTPYLGLGPAAHSFDGRTRRWNHRSVELYIRELAAGRLPVEAAELLTDEQLRLEALFLGFRTQSGIHLETFRKCYGQDLLEEKKEIFVRLEQEGLLEIRDGFVRPTRRGMAVADSLALL